MLSAILLKQEALDQVAEILKPEHFYSEANGRVFEASVELARQGAPIDLVQVASWLRDRERLAQIGGTAYLAQIVDATPAVAHVAAHARTVREKWRLRRLIAECQRVSAEGYGDVGMVQEFIDGAEQAIYELARTPEASNVQPISQVLRAAFEQISKAAERGDRITGISTGFAKLDEKTAGLHDGDLMIVAARPGMGKCLAADAEIVLEDGSIATIEEVYRRRQARLLTLGADHKLRTASPSAYVDDGKRPVFRVTTRLGRQVTATAPHPFLTVRGWRPLDDLRPGDHIGVPRQLPVFGDRPMRDCEVKLLAYLIGDGGLTGANPTFTNTNPRLLEEFANAVSQFSALQTRRRHAVATLGTEATTEGLSSGGPTRSEAAKSAFGELLRKVELRDKSAHDKSIPAPVFQLPRAQLALFLNRLFATDGWATVLASGQAKIGYATVSERLARQLQHLLLRFGVITSVRRRSLKYKAERRQAWQLDLTHARSIRTFVEEIGIFGKEERAWRCVEAVAGRAHHTNRDVVPAEVWERIDAARGTESWRSLMARAGLGDVTNAHVGKRGLARERLEKIATVLGDAALCSMARGDVYYDEIVSIEPLGERQVYDLTIPDTHNFVANDVCVHNTSFVLNLAVNVASPRAISVPGPHERGEEKREPGFGVAVFSLEMPREQLATRMVCSEGRVDVGKLRGGHLTPEDWRRLTEGASYLSMLPVWLDDTPAIGLLELRAKCRRIQAEYNRPAKDNEPERRVGLIVIDYLQLMSGRPGVSSREQEISEISRGLKQLAKELRVPVIALSQLNRAVETRATKEKRPQLSDLRECVTGDTLVCLSDGRRVPIRDLVGAAPEVVAVSEAGKVIAAASDKVWSVGIRPVFDVMLASGRTIRATARHRLLTSGGWKRVRDIGPGSQVAIAKDVGAGAFDASWTEAKLGLLAHLIGDGSYLPGEPVSYSTSHREHVEFVRGAAELELEARVVELEVEGRHELSDTSRSLAAWLAELGLDGLSADRKRVPECVHRLSSDQIGTFLKHLWSTSGNISVRSVGSAARQDSARVFFTTASELLARDVAALLLRVGVVAAIRRTVAADRPLWNVDVTGHEAQQSFLEIVGAFGSRVSAAKRLRATRAPTSRVLLPAGGVADPAHQLDPAALADSDLYWDRVVEVRPAGEEEVFDLTVPGPASWIADGIVSHNSGAIEQDADTIIFIYRDEYYNPDNPDNKGIAELIIAKQRNGPTGKVMTRFTSACTRFDNLQPGDYPEYMDDD